MTPARTPAVGGTREVPVPDAIARDYLLLALRLDQHLPGTVDGYFGPADLKARVDTEQLRSLARLAGDAAALRDALPAEVAEPDRRHWLELQLIAIETLARVAAGDDVPYETQVERCFAYEPRRRPDAVFDAAARELDAVLPGAGSLAERLAAVDASWVVEPDRIAAVSDVVVPRLRARAERLFGLPPDEEVRVSLVRNQPWSGYNWYGGGYRSRVDLNVDLPVTLPRLLETLAHETYPGHHLEHASKEQLLVEGLGRLEASAILLNTPEDMIGEGLAELGQTVGIPEDDLAAQLTELAPLAAVPLLEDRAALEVAASRQATVDRSRQALAASRNNAAFMLHADGEAREPVLEYLIDVGRYLPEVAVKALEFLSIPLLRLHNQVNADGLELLREWVDGADGAARGQRFGRLLREPLTPPAVRALIAEDEAGAA